MITFTRLGRCGRLGNQLWQVASTLGIAQTLGQSAGFFGWDYRPYFCLPDEFFPEDMMSHRLIQADQTPQVQHMDPRAREYLQDYSLWKTIAPQIWSWFQPSELAMETLQSFDWIVELPRPILSVHVRRGDNATAPNNCHPLRPTSYYREAIHSLKGQFSSICFFSDDIEWCKSEFGSYSVEYPLAFHVGIARKKEHEPGYSFDAFFDWIDLQLMAVFADRHIISNSTYAFWGALLSHDEAPIYPTPFFGSDLDYIDTGLMFPKNWIPLEHGQQHVA